MKRTHTPDAALVAGLTLAASFYAGTVPAANECQVKYGYNSGSGTNYKDHVQTESINAGATLTVNRTRMNFVQSLKDNQVKVALEGAFSNNFILSKNQRNPSGASFYSTNVKLKTLECLPQTSQPTFGSPEQLVNSLKQANKTATEIAQGLKNTFNTTSQQATQLLKAAGYTATQVAAALKSVFTATARDAATVLKAAGYTGGQVATALKTSFNASAQQAADALISAFNDTRKNVANWLKAAGYSLQDIAAWLGSFGRTDQVLVDMVQTLDGLAKDTYANLAERGQAVAGLLKGAGVALNDAAKALRAAHAGISAEQVGAWLTTAYQATASEIQQALAFAGFTSLPTAGVSKGINAFNNLALFNRSAAGRSAGNAYLLTYLASAVYPHVLEEIDGHPFASDSPYQRALGGDPRKFVFEFRKLTHQLFWSPSANADPASAPARYVWVHGSSGEGGGLAGYDPEAMVISTQNTIFVIFRGTDRVAPARTEFGYQWLEWLQTDFNFIGIPPDHEKLSGTVHKGFWESLKAPARVTVPCNDNNLPDAVTRMVRSPVCSEAAPPTRGATSNIIRNLPFRDVLLNVISAFNPNPASRKSVWITGHSLGAAHAQLYGAYFSAGDVPVQGVYAVAAPHVGDSSFVAQLNGLFPQNRLQRFDFVDDPVTMLPPRGLPVLDYARAGTRVAYQDIMPPAPFAPERLPELEAKLYSAAMAPGHRGLGLKVLLVAEVLPDLCYHYPAWYMAAAYNQLAPHLKELMPSPLPLPMVGSHFPCGPGHIMRAKKRMVEANPVLFNPVTR